MILSPGPSVFCLQAKGEHEDNSEATILEKTLILPVLGSGFDSRTREHWHLVLSWKTSLWLVMSSTADQSEQR